LEANRPLVLRLTGAGVAPETVRLGDLADLLRDLERAILAVDPEAAAAATTAAVSLVDIGPGSFRLALGLTLSLLPGVAGMTRALVDGRYDRLPPVVLDRLHKISALAVRREWAVEFEADATRGIAPAVISEARPVPAPGDVGLAGTTSVAGKLMRLGGAKPRGELRMGNHELLDFELSEALAKELAPRLYQFVELEGHATWRADGLKLMSFRAGSVGPYRDDPGDDPLFAAFREIAAASAGGWEGVDVDAELTELRREE